MSNSDEPLDEAPSAYSLLTKPTLELSDAEVELIVADLQKRRLAYVSDSKKNADRPDKPKRAPKTADEKKALTASIAAAMNLNFNV